MHEDERPIPLGRAATATTGPAVERAAVPLAPAAATPRPATPVRQLAPRVAAHIERTRPQAVQAPAERGPIPAAAATRAHAAPAAVVEQVVGPAAAAVVEPPINRAPVAGRPASRTPAGEHPMSGLGGFRMEVVDPFAGRGRDIGRFVVAYLLVSAFVLALIVAFVALTAGAGSGQA
jgi:hypothetical protein